jgi:hypothetical protein
MKRTKTYRKKDQIKYHIIQYSLRKSSHSIRITDLLRGVPKRDQRLYKEAIEELIKEGYIKSSRGDSYISIKNLRKSINLMREMDCLLMK